MSVVLRALLCERVFPIYFDWFAIDKKFCKKSHLFQIQQEVSFVKLALLDISENLNIQLAR